MLRANAKTTENHRGIHDMEKEYLGDAVYAEINQFGELELTTGDGQNMRIVLEPAVLVKLDRYLEAYRGELARQRAGESTT